MNPTMITANGAISATNAVIGSAFQLGSTIQQYQYAKMMLNHQEYMASKSFQFEMERMDGSEKLMHSVENITKFKNENTLDNAKAHGKKAVAEAKLTEMKMTQKASRVKNRTLLKAVMNRNVPFYGMPSRST